MRHEPEPAPADVDHSVRNERVVGNQRGGLVLIHTNPHVFEMDDRAAFFLSYQKSFLGSILATPEQSSVNDKTVRYCNETNTLPTPSISSRLNETHTTSLSRQWKAGGIRSQACPGHGSEQHAYHPLRSKWGAKPGSREKEGKQLLCNPASRVDRMAHPPADRYGPILVHSMVWQLPDWVACIRILLL